MSYKRTFRKRITVDYSGSTSASYPASENGGTHTVHYSGTTYEDVEVEIEVATSPFDDSIRDCNAQIDRLTNSVISMDAAQCLAIRQNADRVSDTIIDGFFQSVKSDISTQKMMLQQTVESKLMLLRQQQKTLLEKKEQMKKDYERTSARYQKIFTDLDNELSSRIHKLEQPVFDLVKQVEHENARMLESDLIHTAVTHGKESSMAQANLGVAKIKQDTQETMGKIHNFLENKAVSDATMKRVMVEGKGHDPYLVPVCYISTEDRDGRTDAKCVVPQKYERKNPKMAFILKEKLKQENFNAASPKELDQIKSYVQNEISKHIQGSDPHSSRVKSMINDLLSKF